MFEKFKNKTQALKKSTDSDFEGRFREIISDPLNILIKRDSYAGIIANGRVHLHCGTIVPIEGSQGYYGDFSKILSLNRGVHEPLEEFVFQQMLFHLDDIPSMIELGSYWSHYSMWLKKRIPLAKVTMVEPDKNALEVGINNFKINGFQGDFINDYVGFNRFEIDKYFDENEIKRLTILHSDIQGNEMQMLDGAKQALSAKIIDYLFISTHSQKLHEDVLMLLQKYGYHIEVSADVDFETTSFDGFVFATSPKIGRVFKKFHVMGRQEIVSASTKAIVQYLNKVSQSILPVKKNHSYVSFDRLLSSKIITISNQLLRSMR